ncbi:MAG: hypothetical protein RL033_803 [Pseudomonadota bacterium]|jgi:hypothetical protein
MFSAMSLAAMFSPLTLCRYVLPLACALVLSPSFAAEASDGTEDGALDADAMGDQGLARANAVAAARPHFSRGVELYRAGAYDASLAAFTRAYELAPSYRLLYNLAQVQAQRQDYVQALELFARYLREGTAVDPELALTEARIVEVQSEMTELRRRVAELRIETNVLGAILVVNESRVAELPLAGPLWLNAGIHRMRVEKPGYVSVSKVVTVAGGESPVVAFEMERDSFDIDVEALAVPRLLPIDAPPPPLPSRVGVSVGLVTTGVLTAATTICGLLTYRQSGELDRRLSSYPQGIEGIESSRSRLRTLAVLTDTFGLASLAAAGVTTYLHLSTPDRVAPPRRSPQLGASVSGDGASLWLRGSL